MGRPGRPRLRLSHFAGVAQAKSRGQTTERNGPDANLANAAVPFRPDARAGSGTDIGGRLLADRLTQKWGQSVVIENKPGGDGIVAINAFVSAKDDHVLLLSPTSAFIAHPYGCTTACRTSRRTWRRSRGSPATRRLTVPAVSQANSLNELITLVRAKPGKLNWAGSPAPTLHVRGLAQGRQARHEKDTVPQSVEAGRDLAENRVQAYQSAVAIAQPQIELGKIKLLALLNSVRTPAYPDIPTVAEAGHPAMTIDGLVGLFGLPTMPIALREAIAADVKAVMEADPVIKDRLTRTAQLFDPGGPAEFSASIEHQRKTVAAAAEALGTEGEAVGLSCFRRGGLRRPLLGQAAIGDDAVVLGAAMRAMHADRIFRHGLEVVGDKLDSRPDRLVGVGAAEHQLGHGSLPGHTAVNVGSFTGFRAYSITSSARASTDGGTVRPSALAVLRLMTSSYLVGACTGRSAGFSPLRIRST